MHRRIPPAGYGNVMAIRAWMGVGWASVLVLLSGALHAQPNPADAPPPETDASAELPGEAASGETPATAADVAASAFMMKCIGCHTVGGGALTGPDLKNAATYPRQTVVDGVTRMKTQVGPMTDEEIQMLTDLLMDENAAQRLEVQREQVRMREAATLEPPSADKGEALLFGRAAFENGGLSCAACHQAGGRGGNLASSLEDSFTRLGPESLLSTMENPGFPVMRAIYAEKPVTRQEALHMTAYLEEVSKDPAEPFAPPLHIAGVIGALGLMVVLGRKRTMRAAGTRMRMVNAANRRGSAPRCRERGIR